MIETRIAKLFKNGASQAVRLPAEFRFEGEEVYVTRDDSTGDVVLSTRPGAKTWHDFFEGMMIAAHALSAGAVLVTNNNRHYKRINAPLILVN
jgi:virulence-associated protein VagC